MLRVPSAPQQRMDESSGPGGSTRDSDLVWAPATHPFTPLLTLHSPPSRSALRLPPLLVILLPLTVLSPSRSPCSFPSQHSLLLSRNSDCPCLSKPQNYPYLQPVCCSPLGPGLYSSFLTAEALSNVPKRPCGPSMELDSESVTSECMLIKYQ